MRSLIGFGAVFVAVIEVVNLIAPALVGETPNWLHIPVIILCGMVYLVCAPQGRKG